MNRSIHPVEFHRVFGGRITFITEVKAKIAFTYRKLMNTCLYQCRCSCKSTAASVCNCNSGWRVWADTKAVKGIWQTSCWGCGTVSKRATHHERWSEECFLLDCLSSLPPSTSDPQCVPTCWVRARLQFVCLDMDFPCALWPPVLWLALPLETHPTDRYWLRKGVFSPSSVGAQKRSAC